MKVPVRKSAARQKQSDTSKEKEKGPAGPPNNTKLYLLKPPMTPTSEPKLVPASEIPEVASEEVVLNRRGTPARQRKRNRLYFDDDMVTPDNWGAAIARNAKKVKTEPVSDEEPEEYFGDSFDTSPSPSTPKGRGRSASPLKGPAGKQVQAKKEITTPSPPKSAKTGKGRSASASPEKNSARSSGRQVAVQLFPPERKGKKSNEKNKPPPQKLFEPLDVKPDPDGPPPKSPPKKQKELDRWGKLSQRTNKMREMEEKAAEKRNAGPSSKKSSAKGHRNTDSSPQLDHVVELDDDYGKKSPKKEPVDPDELDLSYLDRLFKPKDKKQTLKEKEQERTKERILKEKKAAQRDKEKEKKRDHRDSITVLPPVVKLSARAAYDENLLHQSSSAMQQQFMAVIKLDDPTGQVIDKRVAQDISIRLRNLLKLPKAHKWVCYEWFYSNVDKVLFEGENDFQICLKETFPVLRARKLTRTEWTKIRRLMGKPRRCSQAFFDEEREELSRRRAKIRQIQQRKVTDFSYKELPDEIPLQLVIGTKVTARLRRPQDGLFTGTIEGVDTSNNTYRITFDRPGLGTHSIPDFEVLSNDPPETVSTSSFALKIPRRTGAFQVGTFKFQNPALLGEQPEGFPKSPFPADGMLGGFPIRLLDMIVRLSKLLKAKREKIMTLKELNVEAEKLKSYGRPYNAEYRARYARCVLDLDSMNKEMAMYLDGIQTYCLEITNDHGSTTQMVIPEHILDSSRHEASMVVSTYNCNKSNKTLVHNTKIVTLVHQLASLLLQIRALSTSDRNLYELKSLKDTIRDVKASLEGRNLQAFQNKIEIPMNRIIAGLCITQPKAY